MLQDYHLENWITDTILEDNKSAEYWNDEIEERKKVFDITDGDFKKLEHSRHVLELFQQVNEITQKFNIDWRGNILSLGAGICWLESWLLKSRHFDLLTAVDFSKHRIHKLAPLVLAHYGIPSEKVTLVWGDILNLKIENESQDVILLSQAFHHINEPIRLLSEIKRVLKGEGRIIVIGEHYFTGVKQFMQTIKHSLKYLINYKNYRSIHSFIPTYRDLFPSACDKGDIHYSKFEYHEFFESTGFDYIYIVDASRRLQGFVLTKH